jgi:hypothetical protein
MKLTTLTYTLLLVSTLSLAACMQANQSKPGTQAETPTVTNPPADNQVACTLDVMQCADGSWVGRSGQNCEFACPVAPEK